MMIQFKFINYELMFNSALSGSTEDKSLLLSRFNVDSVQLQGI